MFSAAYPGALPSFKNTGLFEKIWEKAIIDQRDKKVIWTLGFRGQGDHPFWEEDPACDMPEKRGKLISPVIEKQAGMIRRYVRNPILTSNLYG